MTITQNAVTWRVSDILAGHNLTAYKLAAVLSGKVNRNSVYAIARGSSERVDLTTLGNLLAALEQLTGQRYSVADVLAYDPVVDEETTLLASGMADLSSELAEIEGDTEPQQLADWLAKLEGKIA